MPQEPSSRPPTPILDKIPGPMNARFLSSVGLGFGTRIGRTQLFPTPALDKNRFPKKVLRKVPARNGVPRKVPKKVLWVLRLDL